MSETDAVSYLASIAAIVAAAILLAVADGSSPGPRAPTAA
jgi:hypothetical protein